MNDANDNKPRSRESAYYHMRKAKGDHLLRIWASPETLRVFKRVLAETGDSSELIFASMVEHARHYLEDAKP